MAEGSRFLIFTLDGEHYAFPINRVLEITVPRGLQSDKNLTEVFEGKCEFRGRPIPVLSLRKLLKLPGRTGGALLIVKSPRGEMGVLVDAVIEIVDLGRKPLPMPPGVVNPSLPYYSGLLKRKDGLALVLNGDGLV